MKKSDVQVGMPAIAFIGTTAELAALSATEGMYAYDTTLNKLVVYTGAAWEAAGGSGSGDVVGPAGATDGHIAVFDGATGKLLKDGGAGGGGSVATDTIWDAAGDLAVGKGANTAGRLAMGSAKQLLGVNSAGTALEYSAIGYQKVYENDLSSITNITGLTGTWAISGGVLQKQNSGKAICRLDVPRFYSNFIAKYDVRVIENVTSYDTNAGLVWSWDGSNNMNGQILQRLYFAKSSTTLKMEFEKAGTAAYASLTASITYSVNTWYTVVVYCSGWSMHASINGTNEGGAFVSSNPSWHPNYFGFRVGDDNSYKCEFRNLIIYAPLI